MSALKQSENLPDQPSSIDDTDMIQVLIWALKRAITIKKTFCQFLKDHICRDQVHRILKNRLQARIDTHLDMRNIIENQVTLKMLLKRSLTKKQKLMLDYQRDRLPVLSDTSSSDGGRRDDNGIKVDVSTKYKPGPMKVLLEGLTNFAPETELDRKLLLGIIEREQPTKKTKSKGVPPVTVPLTQVNAS